MFGQYRPTVQDMTDDTKWQKLSNRESAAFDKTREWWKAKDRARRRALREEETSGEASEVAAA